MNDEENPKERSVDVSPACQSVQGKAALKTAQPPEMSADLRGLSTQIQNLSSNIGNFVTAMLSPADSTYLEPTRKRARVEPGCLPGNHAPEHSSIGGSHGQSQSIHFELLEGKILSLLVDAFFQHVGRWIPMVQENTFRRKLLARRPGSALPLLAHAMVVGALRILNRGEKIFSETELEETIEYAMTKVILASNTTVSVESLQSLIVVAFTLVSLLDIHDAIEVDEIAACKR